MPACAARRTADWLHRRHTGGTAALRWAQGVPGTLRPSGALPEHPGMSDHSPGHPRLLWAVEGNPWPQETPQPPLLPDLLAALANPSPATSSHLAELGLSSGQSLGELPAVLQLIPSPFETTARNGSHRRCSQRRWLRGAGDHRSLQGQGWPVVGVVVASGQVQVPPSHPGQDSHAGWQARGCWAESPPSSAQLSLGKGVSIFPAGTSRPTAACSSLTGRWMPVV